MNESKQLIKNTGIIAIGNISTKIVSFFLLPLYTSVLSTSEYGIIDYIFSITIFLAPFVTLLMEEAIFRFLLDCKERREKQRIVSTSLLIVLIGMTVFYLFAIPILIFVQYKYSIYLVLYILTTVIMRMTNALLRGIANIKQYTIYNFVCSSVHIILNVALLVGLEIGIYGMFISYIISGILVSVFYLIKLKLWQYINFGKFDKGIARNMIKYSLPLIPNTISWTIINISDRIIIMNFMGSAATGVYTVSNKFPALMDTVYGFFYQSWRESSARALNESGVENFYNYIYKHLKSFLFAIVVCLTAFMPFLFMLLVNENYNEAITYVPFLILATYFMNISSFYGGVFTAHKDTKIMGVTTIVAATINLTINVFLIWKLGLYAATLSTLVAYFVIYKYRKIKIRRYIKLNENKAKSLVAIMVIAVVWGFFYMNGTIYSIMGCCIAIIYAIATNIELIRIMINSIFQSMKKFFG